MNDFRINASTAGTSAGGQFRPAHRPAGTPAGGQFLGTEHSKPDVELDRPASGIQAGLEIAPGCTPAVNALADAGLQGAVAPYAGSNPDIPEGSMDYTSPSGRNLVLAGTGTEDFTVHHLDPYDENTFSNGGGGSSPEQAVETITRTLKDLGVRDAVDAGFSDGTDFEIRDAEMDRNSEGQLTARLTVSDDEGDYSTLEYNYDTGEATIDADPRQINPTPTMDDLIMDIAWKRVGNTSEAAAGAMFEAVRERAAQDPDVQSALNL